MSDDQATAIREELRAVAREQLGKLAPYADFDRAQLAMTGWAGLEVSETLDGAGVTFAETAVVLEELGRAAVRSGFVGTMLAVSALNECDQSFGCEDLLRRLASGETTAAVIVDDAEFVLDAPSVDVILHCTAEGVVLLREPKVTARPLVDATREIGSVADADGEAFEWKSEAGWQRVRDRAALAIACDSLGVMEAMLQRTVAYAGTREQFGRAIGSFQAVKHACADMLVHVTIARELVGTAVLAVAGGQDDAAVAAGDEISVAASMAKSYVCDAAVHDAGKAMQLHGGIGYTWEGDVHRYLKRALLNRDLFGSPIAHRALLARRYLN
jgi:alkylation response protein AidB-like acyl-CoA dehydrogenase